MVNDMMLIQNNMSILQTKIIVRNIMVLIEKKNITVQYCMQSSNL